jgi:hypothetical protein
MVGLEYYLVFSTSHDSQKKYLCNKNGRCRGKNSILKGNMQDVLRRNGVVEGSSVWNSI